MEAPANRCGYTYTGETGDENCCYRDVWDGSERCIWHEEAEDDETKRIEALERTRAPPEVRDQNGQTGPRELLDGADMRGVAFVDGMDLQRVSLRDADMAEVRLHDADLSGARLVDTTLVDADLQGSTLTETQCRDAEFADVDLNDTDMRGADLRMADFSDAVLRRAALDGANLEGAFFVQADLFDATLTETYSYGTVFTDARANEGTQLDSLCVYDPDSDASPDPWSDDAVADGGTVAGGARHEDIDQLTKAEGTYQELESLCSENALLNQQSHYFVRRQDIHTEEHRREGNWSRWLRARISRAVVLYGESPFRVLAVAAAVIVGSALLYPLGLLRNTETGDLMAYPAPSEPVALVATLADSLYFSTLAFTTMTFGLFEPVGPGKFLTMLETGAGIVLMALLVFVFGRRATR